MVLQVWMVGENGEDLKNPKEFLPVSKLEDNGALQPLEQRILSVGQMIFICSLRFASQIIEIGVLYWHLDPKKPEDEEELSKIRKDRGYSYMDLIEICPGKLENYEEKLKNFFREHMHEDEETRYCLEGGGYFDVRNKDDKWIRIWIKEGDMIVLPAGIYHRFTLDTTNHVKLMRLFIGEPVWTAHNRPQEDHPVRQEYVKSLTDNAGLALTAH
uniref:Uncharacterized protein n=1 Tax=Avena sativa TaxID=4498 RepID=A0ACD5VX97_AVESA